MDRRSFFRNILGVAATTALPSEVWPFRKIFIPSVPQIVIPESGNQLLTIEMITREALRVLANKLTFTENIRKDFDSHFNEMKIGSVINIRKSSRYLTKGLELD